MVPISTTAAGIITGYSNKFGALTSVAGGILCLSQLFSPENLADFATGIIDGLQAAAGQIVAGLLDFVGSVVSNTIMGVTGIISTQLYIIQEFINDIAQTVAMIRGLIESLDDIAKDTLAFLKDSANCDFAAAELGKCLVAGIVEDITRKSASTLVDGSLQYQAKVLDATSNLVGANSPINQFIYKSQMFANKALIQQRF